jgi:hypothetical protein
MGLNSQRNGGTVDKLKIARDENTRTVERSAGM